MGPDDRDCFTTEALVDLFCRKWNRDLYWINQSEEGPHEANFLKLDCAKLKSTFGWEPHWNLEMAIEKTVEWYKDWSEGRNIVSCMDKQIQDFLIKPS